MGLTNIVSELSIKRGVGDHGAEEEEQENLIWWQASFPFERDFYISHTFEFRNVKKYFLILSLIHP